MKYAVVIMDGAAGLPLPEEGGRTCLELAVTPNLDALVPAGVLGMTRTVPAGFEPSSACACMSVLGYDPKQHYRGRAGIEARSLGVPVGEGDAVFRCNLVTVQDGCMASYSAGYIGSEEAGALVGTMDEKLGGPGVQFFPGVGYRHLCLLKGQEETLRAVCTPPHDISDKPVAAYLPRGEGSAPLLSLMQRSKGVLAAHPVNAARVARGELPATTIWLFWGTGRVPELPPFREVYGLDAVLSSGVDLLRGLAKMAGIGIMEIAGVTDGLDNDYGAQGEASVGALAEQDVVVIHVEAPDEAGHDADVRRKVEAISLIDAEVIGRLRRFPGELRLLVMPDHPTPVAARTHTAEPVPFLFWGNGFAAGGARRFTEAEAASTGVFVEEGWRLMRGLLKTASR
ncbi:cofactor-independent phosphoglycerate mutase [Chloroflexota bacterium]